MSDLEIRQFGFKAARPTVGEDNKLSGRAAPFNSWTTIGESFREQIAPGAFNKTLNDGDQVLLDNHDAHRPLARRSAGTLEMHASPSGLDWRASASNTSYAKDIVENVRSGLYGGCSFSFSVPRGGDSWNETPDDGGLPQRTLHEVNCREISIVTFPQYTETSVANRSVEIGLEMRSAFWADVMEGRDLSWMSEDERAKSPKPYGNVKYADPKNGKYPVDTEAHARAAWAYINMPKNAKFYPLNGVTLSEVKDRIRAALHKFGVKISGEQNDATETETTPEHLRGLYGAFTGFVEGFDELTAKRYLEDLEWFNNDFRIRAGREPGESTRMISDEESALLLKRHDEKIMARAKSRKDSFGK